MKITSISFLVVAILSLFSCDAEDARTPLGITISAPDFELTIEENPDPNTILGILTATASDDSIIQFGNIVVEDSGNSKFESETPIGALDIDNQTGELTILDVTAFNFDENTEINATVNAISRNVTEAINITIFINADRRVLNEILETNPDNSLDWDVTETDLNNLTGVTLTDGRVTTLDISGSGLTTIPESISNLSQLTDLNISNNSIETLPDSLGSLINLTDIDFSGNNITVLPETICNAFAEFENELLDSICNSQNDPTEEEEEEEEEDPIEENPTEEDPVDVDPIEDDPTEEITIIE